jgi:arginine-tRNA-protein transferase
MIDRIVHSPQYGPIPLDFVVRSSPRPCPYLPNKTAVDEFFYAGRFPPELYHDFMNIGFRRSGMVFYRPVCPDCSECRPIRVQVSEFLRSRSQKRIAKKNEDLRIRPGTPRLTKEKFRMYDAYLRCQHNKLSNTTSDALRDFLYSSSVDTLEFEYFLDRKLIGVGLTDVCSRSLSSVYFFFDPDYSERRLGTFSALTEILFCSSNQIPFYHLGFYIRDCRSMSYKARFRPCQILNDQGQWEVTERITC